MKMMIRYLIPVFFSFLMIEICHAQSFIGKHKNEVKELMKENRKDFTLDESSRNTVFNLLKYVDHNDNQTFLFVFNENDTCEYYKLICDYSFLKMIQKDLDEKYIRTGEDLWYFNDGKRRFKVTLTKDDWFFSVLTKEVK